VLEAHPKNVMNTMQRMKVIAEEALEKDVTCFPRQECLGLVIG
jgi:hypothetical protein